jgi:flagellar protein FlbD
MIMLTRISGSRFVLNADLIERVDSTPDTVVTLVDGKKYVVLEDLLDVVAAVRRHRGEIIACSRLVEDEIADADTAHRAVAASHLTPVTTLHGEV